MVSFAAALVCAATVFAAGEEVVLHMAAVQATTEGRQTKYFEPALDDVKQAIAPLDYDTFRAIKATDLGVPYGHEIKVDINERYRLHLEPVGMDADGRVRLEVQLLRLRGDDKPPIKALDTTLSIAPGKHLNLGGLPLDRGELVVVLHVKRG